MKYIKYIIFAGLLFGSYQIAFAAPTSTIVQNLIVNSFSGSGTKCVKSVNGLLATSSADCGSGGSSATTTINGVEGNTFTISIIATSSPSSITTSTANLFLNLLQYTSSSNIEVSPTGTITFLNVAGYISTSTGLTPLNFATTSISQWANDVPYLTSAPATTTITASGVATGNAFTFATSGPLMSISCSTNTCSFNSISTSTILAGYATSTGVTTSSQGVYTRGNVSIIYDSSTIIAFDGLSYTSSTGLFSAPSGTFTGLLTANGGITGTSTFFWGGNGNVSGTLAVKGTASLSTTTVSGTLAFIGYSSLPQLYAGDPQTGIHFDGPGIVSLHNSNNQTILFSSTNRVGINNNSPSSLLDVRGTSTYSIFNVQTSSSLPIFNISATGTVSSTFTDALILSSPSGIFGEYAGSACSGGQAVNGVSASGTVTGCFTPAGGSGGVATSSSGVYNDGNIAYFVNSSTISASSALKINSSTGRLGLLTQNPTSTLDLQGSFGVKTRNITVSSTLDASDFIIFANAASGSITVNLPNVTSSQGRFYGVVKNDTSTNEVILDGNGTELIAGNQTSSIPFPYMSVLLINNGSTWAIF